MAGLDSIKDIVNIALKIKELVQTVRQNKHVCEQIGTRVQRLTSILQWLGESEATKNPAMAASLEDLRGTLDKALILVKKCQEKDIFSRVGRILNANDLSDDLKKVNQDIMEHMGIVNFANNVNSSEQNAQIIHDIKSGVHLTLAKDAGQWESSHTKLSLLLGAPIPSRCRRFNLDKLHHATLDFAQNLQIGRNLSSLVYKGVLDGSKVAIKRYTTGAAGSARQHIPNFQRLHQHENIVDILGYCIDTKIEMISDEAVCPSAEVTSSIFVVEEYMPNGSLYDILQETIQRDLDWTSWFRIIQGIARGLAYIHTNHFLYLYVSPRNILFDSNMNPKISSFGFSIKLNHENEEITQTVTEELATIYRLMPESYKKDGIVSMMTDISMFGSLGIYIINRIGKSDRWKSLLSLLCKGYVEDDSVSNPPYSDLCQPTCDPSELKDVRRCFIIFYMCLKLKTTSFTMLDVLEMLDGNMQVLPKELFDEYMTSVLQGAPIPSRWKRFSLAELKTATSDFSDDMLLTEKGSSTLVYKGELSDGQVVAIKDYYIDYSTIQKYLPDFRRMHQDETIVGILGYCIYTKVAKKLNMSIEHILVVEEYMPNGSLHDIFLGKFPGEERPGMDWHTAFGIIRGIAQGLAYIHDNNFIYVYLNNMDILFDSDLNPKISGFGFSIELDHENKEPTQTVAKVETGYRMPPEYIADGVVSMKTDVYRFGRLAYYIITKISCSEHWERIIDLLLKGKTVDPSLSKLCQHLCEPSDIAVIQRCIDICYDCTSDKSEDRPTMPDVVQMLNDLTTMPEVSKKLSGEDDGRASTY